MIGFRLEKREKNKNPDNIIDFIITTIWNRTNVAV